MSMEQIERISEAVEKYLTRNSKLVPMHHLLNKESREHIVRIGTSIMCKKWEIGPTPGSFVTAICSNDLRGAVNRADTVNGDCIRFYVTLYENLEYVN
jgi:hypothetical protein